MEHEGQRPLFGNLREQGWEYVDRTFNGWFFFRKEYDASLPEEQYEIYTDTLSLKEMRRQWTVLAMILLVLMIVFMVAGTVRLVNLPTIPKLLTVVIYGILVALCLIGLRVMLTAKKLQGQRAGKNISGYCLSQSLFFWLSLGWYCRGYDRII